MASKPVPLPIDSINSSLDAMNILDEHAAFESPPSSAVTIKHDPTLNFPYNTKVSLLLRLPNELIHSVVEWLDSYGVKNLIEAYPTNAFFQKILLPILTFKIEEEGGKRSQLCWAAAIGDEEWFQRFLDEGFVNEEGCTRDENTPVGLTALHAAAIGGNFNIINYLLDAGADIEAYMEGTGTPLQAAAIHGKAEGLMFFVNNGANIWALSYDDDGDTALHQASAGGHNEVVQILLDQGLDSSASTPWGMNTPLHYAVSAGKTETVELLLFYGADPNDQDCHGDNSLHLSAKYVKKASEGSTQGFEPVPNGVVLTIVKYLLEYDAEVIFPNANGESAFHLAAQYGHDQMLEVLLEYEDCIDHQNDDYETALHKAAMFGHADTARFLLDRGADTAMARSDGLTPLAVAVGNKHLEIAEMIIAKESIKLVDQGV